MARLALLFLTFTLSLLLLAGCNLEPDLSGVEDGVAYVTRKYNIPAERVLELAMLLGVALNEIPSAHTADGDLPFPIPYYEATDPVKLTYNVADFYGAATKLAQTNLRNVVGETELDQALTSRDVINAKLREVLDEATDKWGVRIVRVEIKRIDPSVDVTQAMHRQMKAEREKRAQILDAEGQRQSRVLAADGEAEAVRRVADAQRYKLEVEAAGEANAITIVYSAIRNANPDDKLIAIQYIDSLKSIANGRASKVFIPYESSVLVGALGGIHELFQEKRGSVVAVEAAAPPADEAPALPAPPSNMSMPPSEPPMPAAG